MKSSWRPSRDEHFMKARLRIPQIIIEIRPSAMLPGQVGLFATRFFRKGAIVAPAKDFEERFVSVKMLRNANPVTRRKIRAHCLGNEDGVWLPRHCDLNRLSIQWYMNHSCDPNVGLDHHENFAALRNISSGEELVWDFGTGQHDPRWSMACKCGTANCRGVITGSDWRRPELQVRYKDHFLRALQVKIARLERGLA